MGRLFLFAIGVLAVSAFAEMPGTLITEGDFHGDEMSAEAGSEWWGVVSTEAGFVLRKVTISVETRFDAISDNDENNPTGKRVTIAGSAGSEHSVFLVKGIEGLREGPVQTVFEGVMRMLPGYPIRLGGPAYSFAGRPHISTTLLASGTVKDPVQYCCASDDYRLEIEMFTLRAEGSRETKEQALLSVEDGTWPTAADAKMPEVRWIGDLDRDGVFDYLIDTSSKYSVWQLTLYLSSAAKDGQIVAPVAVLRTVGC